MLNRFAACLSEIRTFLKLKNVKHPRADARAVDLGGPSVYHGGPKFEIKYKSSSLQKIKLVNWGGQACRLGRPGPPGPSLAPALKHPKLTILTGSTRFTISWT